MAEYFVRKNAPAGGDGSAQHPFSSVEEARDAVRLLIAEGLTEPVTVKVGAGEYRTRGIVFDGRDSGTPEYPVLWCAAGDGEVVFNGGMSLNPADFRPVTGAERDRLHGDAKENVVCIDLTALGLTAADWGGLCTIGSYNTAHKYDGAFTAPMWCELFVNDRRMEIARYPDTGYLHTLEPVREGYSLEPTGQAKRDPAEWEKVRNPLGDIRKIDADTAKRAAGWKSLENVWVFGYPKYGWADMASPVDRIDPVTCEMETRHVSMYGIREHAPYYFFNVFEELDAPGEWFLDRERGILCIYADRDFASSEINLSLLTENLIRFRETSHVTLRGFTFTGTRSDALDLTGNGNAVEDCLIKNVAGNAVLMRGTDCRVSGCEICHTGRGGVIMSGGDRQTLTPSGNLVTDNHIHHIAEIYRTYQPAAALSGVACVCSHNVIHDSAHMAISFSGNNHVMEYNEIYEVCQIADDSSAIYSGRDYTVCGNIVRCNFFHDMKSDADNHIGIFGMYCDDNLGSCTIEKNIFLRCQSALLLHGGHDMVFANNLILEACPKSQYSIRFHRYGYWETLLPGGTHEANLSRVPWQGQLWSETYPHIAEYLTWDPETEQCIPHYCRIAGNIIINHKPIDIRGFDCGDPRLHNIVENNAERTVDDLRTLTPALLRSFVPDFEDIPFDRIGRLK